MKKNTIHPELRKEIIKFMMDHEYTFNRLNVIVEEFRPYIYNAQGQYLIGGQDVYEFIHELERVLFM